MDTGAAKTVLKTENIPSSILTGEIITSLLVSSSTPENLLGADVLSQIQACIQYTPDGIKVTTPLSDEVLNQASAAILLAKCVATADIPDLSQVPETLWAIDRYDVGLLNVTPVHVKLKEGAHLPRKPQYSLNPQQIEGIQLKLDRYLEKDVVAKCTSPENTPLFPVKKKGEPGQPTVYWLVHDLREVNKLIEENTPIVPNPHTLLTQIPPTATCFSVTDLANAYFSVPLTIECQHYFAFTMARQQYTWKRLPQGMVSSLSEYNAALSQILSQWKPKHSDTVLLQYVDDLLL